ncbi:hypothetical protein Lalb_Chr19g0128601 [Lupinus albus]|uniref:Uncharacterized protein n=1 Tax=Lupinus albus TaxID=3870 RepID=A0A6A4NT57_LUPAL|nr:hypothetical protein Lalb_Chr19g0128601 [Lupinus albus]
MRINYKTPQITFLSIISSLFVLPQDFLLCFGGYSCTFSAFVLIKYILCLFGMVVQALRWY